MTTGRSIGRIGPSARRGLTLVEAVVSMIIVSVMLVAALNTIGVSRTSQRKTGERSRGVLLAQQLTAEILQQNYEEPDDTPTLGREPSESGGDRANYDDVDDYDGWKSAPPEEKDGTQMPNLDGWERSVTVVWVNPADLGQLSVTDTKTKRITVTVTHSDVPVAELVALKTMGLPPPKVGPTILFVVTDDSNPTAQESTRQTLMQSWGFTVTLIRASESQSVFDEAVANVDAAYVSEEINDAELGTKLKDATIGAVNEDIQLYDEFGFSGDLIPSIKYRDIVEVVDNTHYITSPFSIGSLTIFSSLQPVHMLDAPYSPGLQVLTKTENVGGPDNDKPSLAVLEFGAELYGGGVAAGRRVQLPWGSDDFDISALNADGQTIMKRAVEWAAGWEEGGAPSPSCGDGTCDAGEDTCNCAGDCGAPPSFEEPGVNCADGLDNDCDGQADCADVNCFADAACGPSCGNGVCEAGEDCNTCSSDCLSKTSGPASGRYCCGNGVLEAAEGDGSICDGNP